MKPMVSPVTLISLVGALVVALAVLLFLLFKGSRRGRSFVLMRSANVLLAGGDRRAVRTVARYTFPTVLAPTYSVDWAPSGKYIAVTDQSRVQVWAVSAGRMVFTYRGHERSVRAVAWAPGGLRLLASGDQEGAVQSWNFRPGRVDSQSFGRRVPGPVLALAWSPGADVFVSGGDTVLLRHAASWELRVRNPFGGGHAGLVQAVTWSPDGGRIASAGGGASIFVWEYPSGRHLTTYHATDEARVTALAYAPDGNSLAAACADGTIKVWEDLGEEVASAWTEFVPTIRIPRIVYRGHQGVARAISWSPDGKRIASGGDDGSVQVWSTETGALHFLYATAAPVLCVKWSPVAGRGERIAIGSSALPFQMIQVPLP